MTPYKVYSSDTFFAQCGSGTTAKKAELDAVEKLAAIFNSSITSKSVSSSRMKQAQKSGDVVTGKISEFSQDVMRKVSVEDLIGIEIKESYVDGKTYYALAVMNKPETAKAIVSTIQLNNKKIKSLLDDYASGDATIENYGRLNFAAEIASLNERYLSKLDVLNPTSAANLKKQLVDSASIQSELSTLASYIPVFIVIENDSESNQIKQAFAQMVKSCKLSTSENPGERYSLAGKLALDIEKSGDGKICQSYYVFEGYLTDTAFGVNLLPIKIEGRERSTTESEAIRRAYQAITSKIKTTTTVSFLNFLNSL